MNVRVLTTEQKDLLVGQTWGPQGQYFNPTLDADGNWFISQEEVDGCIHVSAVEWIHNLPLIPYNPVVSELPL